MLDFVILIYYLDHHVHKEPSAANCYFKRGLFLGNWELLLVQYAKEKLSECD